MGGWIAMPGFCSCGFMPRPSGGIQSRRSYGLAPKHIAIRKNRQIIPKVPVTYGIMARFVLRFVNTAIAEYVVKISAQKSIDPDCPAQKAVNV